MPSSKVEDKIASFHSLVGFWSQYILTLRNTVPVHIWVSWKATGFEWVVARKSSAAQSLGPISSRRPYNAGGIRMGKNFSVDFMASPSERITKLWGLEQGQDICSGELLTIRKTTSGMLLGSLLMMGC